MKKTIFYYNLHILNTIKVFSIILLFPFTSVSQTNSENYIKTLTYKEPVTDNTFGGIYYAHTNVTYFDGLGRPIQIVSGAASEGGKDIIKHIEYDAYGRQAKDYLPYKSNEEANLSFKDDALGKTFTFYSNPTPQITGNPHFESTSYPYSETHFEKSPLNRITKEGAPGDQWHIATGPYSYYDHGIETQYKFNNVNEVKLFRVNSIFDPECGLYYGAIIDNGFYDPNKLYKQIVSDENHTEGINKTTIEFKDKSGKIILKRNYNKNVSHDTYYIYDQYSNLMYVLPPLVNANDISQEVLDNLCYQYKYDNRNRLVEKKLPGKIWESIVYDRLDRVVAIGPSLNPFDGKTTGWLITKYDALNRIVYTGWNRSDNFSCFSRNSLQHQQNNAPKINEERVDDNTIDNIDVNYSNTISPIEFKLLTVNYYDNYDFPNASANPQEVDNQIVIHYTNNLLVGKWVRILKDPSTSLGQTETLFYDTKGRVIRSNLSNYLDGDTKVSYKLSFDGKIQKNTTSHKRLANDNEIYVVENYSYSVQGRLQTTSHRINSMDVEPLASNTYDEVGQLISKKVGAYGGSTESPLQEVNYRYNIRGWLTDINTVSKLNNSNQPQDLFAFKINYDIVQNTLNGAIKPLFNGNISETFWRSNSDDIIRKYGYSYDDLNRITDALYQKSLDNTITETNSYNEHLSYDKNGNIRSLRRNGFLDNDDGNTLEIDNLQYDYPKDSNQLKAVTDLSQCLDGFKDNNSPLDFIYDDYGNMITDNNKGITQIFYNHLNLPIRILFENGNIIEYLYDAEGKKLRKNVFESGSNDIGIDYLSGFQYEDGILQFFPTAEGYVTIINGKPYYIYNYTDHLGNIRLSYGIDPATQELKIIEENHYYPFGLKHSNYNAQVYEYVKLNNGMAVVLEPTLRSKYQYKYNGKEWQDELGLNMYDYGARNYDPAIGRWMNVDPLSEKSRRWSPYNYCFNNPVYFIDPDGMSPDPGDLFKTKADAAKDFAQQYNGISIINKVELKSLIYEVKNGSEVSYSYTVPEGLITMKDGVNISGGTAGDMATISTPNGEKPKGDIHTHGNDPQNGTDVNQFSYEDKTANRNRATEIKDNVSFVSTPGGLLIEHDPYIKGDANKPVPGQNTINVIDTQIPSDPNSAPGKRANNVSPNVVPNVMPIINGEKNYPLKTKI